MVSRNHQLENPHHRRYRTPQNLNYRSYDGPMEKRKLTRRYHVLRKRFRNHFLLQMALNDRPLTQRVQLDQRKRRRKPHHNFHDSKQMVNALIQRYH